MNEREFTTEFEVAFERVTRVSYNLPHRRGAKSFLSYLFRGRKATQVWLEKLNRNANSLGDSEADRAYESLCDLYLRSSPPQRQRLRDALPSYLAENLLHFCWRKHVRALAHANKDELKYGIVALCIEDQKYDLRETKCMIAVCFHVATQFHVDVPSMLAGLGAVCSDSTAKLFRVFSDMDPSERLLSRWTFVERRDEKRPRIERMLWVE